MRKKEIEGWVYLIIIVLIIGGFSNFFKTFGFVVPSIIAIIIIALWIWISNETKKARRKEWFEKYKIKRGQTPFKGDSGTRT